MPPTLGNLYDRFSSAVGALASHYLFEARFDDALALLNAEALDLVKKDSSATNWARLQIQRASILRYKGYCYHTPSPYDDALTILASTMSVVEASQDRALWADALDLMGLAQHSKGQGPESSQDTGLGCFERALALRQAINDVRGTAESHFHIGMVYQSRRDASDDDSRKALENLQRAYELASEGGHKFEQAHAARHLAYMHDRQGDQDSALVYHKEFLDTNQALGFKPYLPPAQVMVGLAHFRRGEVGDAAHHFRAGYALASQMGSQHFLADCALMLGVAAKAEGDIELARRRLDEALSLAEGIGLARVSAIANREIAKLEQAY